MKAADVIQRAIKKRTFSECFDFDIARQKLLAEFDKISTDTNRQLELNFNNDLLRLKELRSKKRYASNYFMAEQGIELFLIKYNYEWQVIKKLYLEAGFTRQNVCKIIREFKKFIAEHRTPKERNLIAEIRRKLAA